MVSAALSPGWVSSVKIELLPHAAHGGSVLRQGAGGLLRVALAVRGADGKSKVLGVRHAGADLALGRFANSFEIIGIQGGWSLDPSRNRQPHASLWLLESPIQVSPGETLTALFRGAKVGCVRISASPFGPANPEDLTLSSDHLRELRGPADSPPTAVIAEAYARGTGRSGEVYARLKALDASILSCRRGMTPVMVTETVKPVTMRVLSRGNWQDETGAIVEPSLPHFLPIPADSQGRRLTRMVLANWLVSPDNPLTARMVVNRLWKQFFGTALSDKVEDLGTQGEWPTHPELLDWLAVEFRTPTVSPTPDTQRVTPWSIKHIVRLIVTSETYRQSSKPGPDALKVDPQNRLLASQNPRRLEAELVRDNALAIAGLLNLDHGGPPCKPYQPADYYANLQFPDRDYIPDGDDRQWRRGVYMHWQRTFLHPMLANFDAPSREDCVGQRTVANTPQQALTLLNDPQMVEAARALAARLLSQSGGDGDRLEHLYQLALGRSIKPAERKSLLGFLAKVRAEYRRQPEEAGKLLQVGQLSPPKSDSLEAASWTSVARVVLNLHETITRY